MKLWRVGIAALAVLVMLVAGLAWTLLYTAPGAHWVLDTARRASGNVFDYGSVDGSISGGLYLTDIGVTTGSVTVAIDDAELTIDIDVLPAGVLVEDARLDKLAVDIRTGSEDAAGPDSASFSAGVLLEGLRLPVELRVQNLEAGPVAISLDGEPLIEQAMVSLSAAWHDGIDVTRLDITSPGASIQVAGGVVLDRPFPVSALASVAAEPGLTGLPEKAEFEVALQGDLERLGFDLALEPLGIFVNGALNDVLVEQRRWQLDATAPELATDGVRIESAKASSSGWLDDYTLRATWIFATAGERLDAELSGTGSLDAIDVSSFALAHPAGQLELKGRADFRTGFRGTADVQHFDPAWFGDAWPDGVPINATAAIDASPAALVIEQGELAAGATRAQFNTVFEPDSGRIDAEFAWQALRWPMQGAPLLQSREGRVDVKGRIDDWQAEASLALASPDVADGRFRIVADGSATAANIDIVEGDVLGGSLDGAVDINWGDAPAWRSGVDIEHIATGTLLTAMPGTLSTRVAAESIDGLASARIEIQRLEGTVLDVPLAGSGVIEVSASALRAEAFRIAHGTTELELDGDLLSRAGLEFAFATSELGDYVARAAGDLAVAGTASAMDPEPVLDLVARSDALEIDRAAIGDLGLNLSTEGDAYVLNVAAAELAFAGRKAERIELRGRFAPDRQQLSLDLTPLSHRIELEFDGRFSDWRAPLESTWQGAVTRFRLTTPADEYGSLKTPAPLSASTSQVKLESFCVDGSKSAELCASFAWASGGALSLASDAKNLPIDVFESLLQTGFSFSQELTGSVRWQQRPEQPVSGALDVQLTAGSVRSDNFPELDLETAPGKLSFVVEDGTLLEGRIDLPLPGTGFLDGQFAAEDIGEGTSSPVKGSINARINDIEVLAAFLPDVDDLAGILTADLEISGTLSEPLFHGDAELANGTLNYFPLGLVLDDINLSGEMNDRQGIDLRGQFRAGEGTATVRTTRETAEDTVRGLHFEVQGDNLSVINLPDVSARASADLELDLTERGLDIDGLIDIPYARILPRNLAVARADASPDVVVVAGELPGEEEPSGDEEEELEVFGQLTLSLGDDVEVNLDVASARLTGSTDFVWNGDLIPMGLGRYDMVGSVEAFGQVLDIREGGIRFPNVPADNPNIRLRATREIFGNSQIKRAGVLVSGSAQRPTIEAYTYPRTTDERALALLITGNDFDFEEGVGSIDFGTYIAPRLFLSYGVGVFTRENIVSARYDLTSGWGVRVSSGARDSGMDMTYRIER